MKTFYDQSVKLPISLNWLWEFTVFISYLLFVLFILCLFILIDYIFYLFFANLPIDGAKFLAKQNSSDSKHTEVRSPLLS